MKIKFECCCADMANEIANGLEDGMFSITGDEESSDIEVEMYDIAQYCRYCGKHTGGIRVSAV